jgi:hypothetical protein
MPKPPGNRVDSPIRGHRTRSAADKSPYRQRPYRASIVGYVSTSETSVKIKSLLPGRFFSTSSRRVTVDAAGLPASIY